MDWRAIAIAGIWLGIGLLGFSKNTDGIVVVSIMAMIATLFVCLS